MVIRMDTRLIRAVEMMIRTDHMHKNMIDSCAKDIGLHRTQHRILMILLKEGKLISQKTLAQRLEITPAAVTGALKKLENEGYISKVVGDDSRFNELYITEAGKEFVERVRNTFSATDQKLFADFTDEELEVYIRCLEKMQNNIRAYMEASGRFSCR